MAKTLRQSEAHWIESQKRWRCQVKSGNVRKNFYSSNPSRIGKREAERKADEWLALGAPDTQLRFGAAWQRFLDHEKKIRGDQNCSYKQHKQYGELYILPFLQYIKLVDMAPLDWKSCIDENYARSKAKDKPLSKKTLKGIRGALSAFKSYCNDAGITLRGYPDIKIPDDAPVGVRRILQPDDIRKLFAPPPANCNTHYLHAWRLQIVLGLRPGELYAIMPAEDIQGNLLTINRSVNVHNVITPGKNSNARRTMVLSDTALSIIDNQKAYLRSIGVISPYLFPDENGNITHQKTAYARWIQFAAKCGITACSAYELRHTAVSVCVDVPDPLLKMTIGHSKNMDTRGVYNHEMIGEKELAAKLIESSFAKILNENTSQKNAQKNASHVK